MRRSTLLLIVSFVLVSRIASSQAKFQKYFDGGLRSGFIQPAGGGYIISGTENRVGVYDDIYLLRTDNIGDTLWSRSFGASGSDRLFFMQPSTDGGFLMTGYSSSFGSPDKIILLKADSLGNLLWVKSMGGPGSNNYGYDIIETYDGNYMLAGSFGISPFSTSMYLVKLDNNGDTLWTKLMGGAMHDFAFSIKQTQDSGYIVAGSVTSFGAGNYDAILIKTDSTGSVLWAKTYGLIGFEDGLFVSQTPDGGYLIAGETDNTSTQLYDLYLIKTDNNGDTLWTKMYGGPDQDQLEGIFLTADNNILIYGFTNSFSLSIDDDGYLIKTDSSGNVLWSKIYGGVNHDYIDGVVETPYGYILTGLTKSFTSGNELYMIMTDKNGNSGCFESDVITTVNPFPIQITNAALSVTSGGTVTSCVMITHNTASNENIICTDVGVEEDAWTNSMQVSPNPSTGNFEILFQKIIDAGEVELINILGERIFQTKIVNELKIEIQLVNRMPGIYFVKIFDGENYIIKKIVVR
jgi:hypothetical protein